MRGCPSSNRQYVPSRLQTLYLAMAGAFLLAASDCRLTIAADLAVTPKAKRSQFDMEEVRRFISRTLSRTASEGSLRIWGIQTRKVRGRVVDHDGQPIAGAHVAFVEPIGFSRQCYDENFDKTDDQGRFLVEGGLLKSRLVVRRSDRQIWATQITGKDDNVEIVWPQPAAVHISVDADLLQQDAPIVRVTSARYRGGMSTLTEQYELDEKNSFEITDQLPGDFTISVQRTIKLGEHSESRYVEVGSFHAEPGADLAVRCRPTGNRRVSGKCPPALKGPAILYVDRIRTKYEDGYRTFDLVACEDGTFTTVPLPPGSYVLRFKRPPQPKPAVPRNRAISGFRPVYAEPEWLHRFVVPDADKPLIVDTSPPQDKVAARVQSVLDSRGAMNVSWSHTDVQVAQLQRDSDREAVERELLRLYSDPTTPQQWMYTIRRTLGGMLDSPEVRNVLFEQLRSADHLGDRTAVLGIFRDSRRATREIIDAIAEYRHDENIYIRSSALNALGRLIDADEVVRPVILPWLIEATTDQYDRLRSDMVATLGRIKAEEAVPALEVAMKDPIGKVRVMAAWALWRITGERERPIKLMTVRLRASDHSGKVEAANFLGEFDELPEITLKQLRPFTLVEVKPPYRGEKLLKFQLKNAATRTLKKVSPDAPKPAESTPENAESQKFD